MGPVAGFVFEAGKTVYVAGDTVWYSPAEEAVERVGPDLVVLDGGEARFEQSGPITMGIEAISSVRDSTEATVDIVHMEAINHCLLTRDELRSATEAVHVPEDGAQISQYGKSIELTTVSCFGFRPFEAT